MSKVDEREPEPEIADPTEPSAALDTEFEEVTISDPLADLECFYAVNESVASDVTSILSNLLNTQLSETNLKDKLNKYVRPGNCASLTWTRVNSEI